MIAWKMLTCGLYFLFFDFVIIILIAVSILVILKFVHLMFGCFS